MADPFFDGFWDGGDISAWDSGSPNLSVIATGPYSNDFYAAGNRFNGGGRKTLSVPVTGQGCFQFYLYVNDFANGLDNYHHILGFHDAQGLAQANVQAVLSYDKTLERLVLTNATHSVIIAASPNGSVMNAPVWRYIRGRYKAHGSAGLIWIEKDRSVIINSSGLRTRYGTAAADSYSVIYLFSSITNVGAPDGGRIAHFIHGDDAAPAPFNDVQSEQRTYKCKPTGDGTYNTDWPQNTGANRYLAVDDPTAHDGDATYVADAIVGNKVSFAMADLPAQVTTVTAVQLHAVWRKDDSTTRAVARLLRDAAGTDDWGVDVYLTPSYTKWTEQWLVSPFTGVAFTVSEVNGMQAGVKVTV